MNYIHILVKGKKNRPSFRQSSKFVVQWHCNETGEGGILVGHFHFDYRLLLKEYPNLLKNIIKINLHQRKEKAKDGDCHFINMY